VAMSAHEMNVSKDIDKFMMELAAPASKHTATGSIVLSVSAVIGRRWHIAVYY